MASASNQRNQGCRRHNRQQQGPWENYSVPSQETTQAPGVLRRFIGGVFPGQQAGADREYDLDMSGYVTAEEHEQLELQFEKDNFLGQVFHMKQIIKDLRRRNKAGQQDLRAQEAKAADLQQQLLTFKAEVAASTRTESQLTDDEVRQKMDRVFYGIQNFVLEILRGKDLGKKSHRLSYPSTANPKKPREDRIELSNEGKAPRLGHTLVLDTADKSYLVQLIIGLAATIVVDLADPKYLFRFPTDGTTLKGVADFAAHMKVNNVASFKEWLQSTRKMMQEYNKEAVDEADRKLLLAACDKLQMLLGDAIVLNWEIEAPRLIKILTPARDLFRTLHSAKADFYVEMMPVQFGDGIVTFDTDTMTAVQSDEEEPELLGRDLQISVFPIIYKYGDEMGQNMEEMTMVCKAKVVVQKPNVAKEDARIKVED
ncbi:hypothetical protein KC331_g658 [Hortaea werneckii]|nr:hypothetical protein KC331_g658 [Hortaea werneckii]KAI7719574.1 hypothetical protein KC353_g2879 [Hortaea werneckii]